ncbi:hypothetical protein PsYK624_000570 [Phanerochaete sordida]|uniref:Uncharacterized protein n=1 Tax=Phanerochaete sordida TaxID=48140 RepID=A0A9P3L7G7_9APHY|nr:hypothetical protein PsYK624_000570 [Phanerochaete sordida]
MSGACPADPKAHVPRHTAIFPLGSSPPVRATASCTRAIICATESIPIRIDATRSCDSSSQPFSLSSGALGRTILIAIRFSLERKV